MTPQQFADMVAAKPFDYPLVEKIIDKEGFVSFSQLHEVYIGVGRKIIEVVVIDRDFALGDAGWEGRKPTTWTMAVTDKMMVGVYDAATGLPKTKTVPQFTGEYVPYGGDTVEGETPPLGEPIFEDVEVPRMISEWQMWLNYIFFNAAVPMREAFRQGILKRKGLDNTPLKYFE